MDNFQILQGAALDLTVTLTDSQGSPITTYLGTEALAARVWPGGNLPPVFAPAVAWTLPSAGTIGVAISGSQTAALAEGLYLGTLALTDPALGVLEAYRWSIDVRQGPGTGTAPRSYVNLGDLMEFGGGWLRTLMVSGDDEAGFLRQCGRATTWLDDLILSSWETSNRLSLGDPGYGAASVGQGSGQLPSAWLRQQLEANKLIQRDLVKEVVANRALALICQGKLGVGDNGQDFAKLASFYRNESNQLAKTLRAEIDTNGDGLAELAVNLGSGSAR